MSNLNDDLNDPTLDEYDPARRRRKWAFDPSRRRRTHRKGKMPAGLKRYWAMKGRGSSYHPHRHRSRHRRHDPARRHMRIFGRRRRHDPGFGSQGSWTRSATDYGGVALGSMLHNFVTHTKGFLANTLNLGPLNITQLGGLAGLIGIVGEHQRMIEPNGILSDVLKGMFAEGLNAPMVESIQRTGSGGALNQGSGGGPINFAGKPTDGYYVGGQTLGVPPGVAAPSPTGIGPAGYVPVWAYT